MYVIRSCFEEKSDDSSDLAVDSDVWPGPCACAGQQRGVAVEVSRECRQVVHLVALHQRQQVWRATDLHELGIARQT